MSADTTDEVKPTHEEIATLAHAIWEREGRPQGRELQHWNEAEALLRARQEASQPERRLVGKPLVEVKAAVEAAIRRTNRLRESAKNVQSRVAA